MRRSHLVIGVVALLIVGVWLLAPRVQRHVAVKEAEELLERSLPSPTVPAPPVRDTGATTPDLRAEVNLPVPFTSQAPHANWDLPYKEACEEASVLMAIRYAFGNAILSPEDADKAIRELARINEEVLGYPIDQDAAQVKALILESAPSLTVRLLTDPSVEDLQQELSAGNAIIVPAAGRQLGNPFFQSPGPLYHMLVLRGYTDDGYFITNDPGTKRGEGYIYPFARIMEAMHDWNGGNVEEGRKVVIVVEPLAT